MQKTHGGAPTNDLETVVEQVASLNPTYLSMLQGHLNDALAERIKREQEIASKHVERSHVQKFFDDAETSVVQAVAAIVQTQQKAFDNEAHSKQNAQALKAVREEELTILQQRDGWKQDKERYGEEDALFRREKEDLQQQRSELRRRMRSIERKLNEHEGVVRKNSDDRYRRSSKDQKLAGRSIELRAVYRKLTEEKDSLKDHDVIAAALKVSEERMKEAKEEIQTLKPILDTLDEDVRHLRRQEATCLSRCEKFCDAIEKEKDAAAKLQQQRKENMALLSVSEGGSVGIGRSTPN